MTPPPPHQAPHASQTGPVQPPPSPPAADIGPSGCTPTVWALIPCFNRPADLALLLGDLAHLDPSPSPLRVIIADNASAPPLTPAIPPALNARVLRLPTNTGGSGGFNAALTAGLANSTDPNDLFWLLDSDARVEPGALAALVRALRERPDAAVAGSALAEPGDGPVFEVGGRIDRRTGELTQPPPPQGSSPIEVEYVAACSMIVRRSAVERAGLMADLFINGDDAEWCLRIGAGGGRILAVPSSIARHPRPDKMRTWDRYYAARNAFAILDRAGAGPLARFRRAWRESARAACQALVGRDDLAALHLRGLADALAGHSSGAASAARLAIEPFRPFDELAGALRESGLDTRFRLSIRPGLDPALVSRLSAAGLHPTVRAAPGGSVGAALRLLFGETGTGIVSARARPADWWAGPTVITFAPQGFFVSRTGRWRRILSADATLARGLWLAARLGLRGPGAVPRIRRAPGRAATGAAGPGAADLTIVILSFNRWPALNHTLTALGEDPALRIARIIVADNASTDSSAEHVGKNHPGVSIVRLDINAGVAGFNRGADLASSEFILILDDDAVPAPGALTGALELLRQRTDLGAVALHPRHPADGRSEWPFGAEPCDDWPVMGCANLVRKEAWEEVGGYEERFFLYRNDTDLAMKLAAAGWGVHFNPGWVALHDSPAAASKSLRWFELATRNWVWLCRRHGRGLLKVAAIGAGWLWAHKEAGLGVRAHWRVLKGAVSGLFRAPPPLPAGLRADGRALRRLMRMRLGRA